MSIEKVNIAEKLNQINDFWNPRIAGELNGQYVKLTKMNGAFVWHKHDDENELFLVIKASFTMKLREKKIEVKPVQIIIIAKGVEHTPVSNDEVDMMLYE